MNLQQAIACTLLRPLTERFPSPARGKKYLQAAQNVKLSKRSVQPHKHDHSDLFAIREGGRCCSSCFAAEPGEGSCFQLSPFPSALARVLAQGSKEATDGRRG